MGRTDCSMGGESIRVKRRLENDKLLRTNVLVSIILVVGFTLTAIFAYQANYRDSLNNIEQVSSLATEGIYYRMSSMLTRPVDISLALASDSLLADHLSIEGEHMSDEAYVRTTRRYLEQYREKYGFDSVFLISTATRRYYNFNGVDRVLAEGDMDNTWYFDLMESSQEYSINVDKDEAEGADNEITVFANCKIQDEDGKAIGVIGVGIRMDYLKELLEGYEEKFHVNASLVGSDGSIEVSTRYAGYGQTDWFDACGQGGIRQKVLGWEDEASNLELWSPPDGNGAGQSYIVVRYIPELDWHLIVTQDTEFLIRSIKSRISRTFLMITVVIVTVLVVITAVIRNFNRQITELIEERQAIFKRATEQLYDNINEINVTKNCYVGERTKQYFEGQGAKGLPYDKVLQVIAQNQIKEEFREGYVSTFCSENVLGEYEMGRDHLQYDFMISQDGGDYEWMRTDAYIFFSAADESIHMFTYRKNINEEKQSEKRAEMDEMTGLYSKKATERVIAKALADHPDAGYAFYIFDIDNFKQANDRFGHAFGDYCIKEFVGIIRRHFRDTDIMGRIGGDEFVVFIPAQNEGRAREKARELSEALDVMCRFQSGEWRITASIGVAMSPKDGNDFESLYRNADQALYRMKNDGKSGYAFFDGSEGV